MKLFGRSLEGFAKALVILVAIFLVSGGLCGLSLGIANAGVLNGPSSIWGNLLVAAGLASGAIIVLSLLGIVIVAIVWLISAAVRRSSSPSKDHARPLLDSDKDQENKDSR